LVPWLWSPFRLIAEIYDFPVQMLLRLITFAT
jgi:hypothetical protein